VVGKIDGKLGENHRLVHCKERKISQR
jgi:hypothetical protein